MQSAQVDEPADPRIAGLARHRLDGVPFGLLEVPVRTHGVREVVDGLDALDSGTHRVGVLQVALSDLDVVVPGHVLELPRRADEDADVVSGLEEAGDETTADVPGRTGDEDLHGGHGTRVASG